MLRFALSAFLLHIAVFCANAQDIHYVHTTNSPLNISPALTGIFRGDYRFAGSYRQQWRTVPVNYLQFSGAFDMPIAKRPDAIHPTWSGGLLLNYDRAGDGLLKLLSLGSSASYTRRLSARNFATLGAQVGLIQRTFDPTGLYFDDQYDGDTNSGTTNETFARDNVLMFDFSAGLNWAYKHPNNRTAFNTGVGLFHINRPDKAFTNQGLVLYDPRLALYSQGSIRLVQRADLLLSAVAQWQGPHQESLWSIGGRYHVNQLPTKELAINANISWRPKDAIIPQIGVFYKNWQMDLSYDINTSGFQRATAMRGGPEISIVYIITKVPPMQYCPLCPTYL